MCMLFFRAAVDVSVVHNKYVLENDKLPCDL